MLVDGAAERLIGFASLNCSDLARSRHVGGIGMMVSEKFQRRGVGRALLVALLSIADDWLALVRVELDIYLDNVAAITLVERFGFEREGVARCAAVRDGRFVDLLHMGRIRPAPSVGKS